MTQQAFGFRAGYPRADGFAVSFISLSNADLTITCNGFTDTISGGDWVEVGTDHPDRPGGGGSGLGPARVGYMASTVVTGQAVFLRHEYTVSQGVVAYSGSAMTAPRRGDDFSIFFDTCRNNSFSPESPTGSYQHMRDAVNIGRDVIGVIHADDHYGYISSVVLDDSAGTGHASTGQGQNTELEYDYAMAYFAAFGLFVNETGGAYDGEDWGQNELNIWAMRNLNVLPQWGDWDAGGNEMGWDIDPSLSTGFTNAKRLWDLFMGPLQPPSISNRATANHWGVTLGALTIVAPDGITLASGDGNDANIAIQDYGPTDIYTINQIDDCLDALNTDAPFKLLGLSYSIKFLGDPSSIPANQAKFALGAQNPLKNSNAAEFRRMFTREDDASNPLSIMANPKTNGVHGTFGALHGDKHVNTITRNQSPAFTGHHAEDFYSFCVATGNGSVNFGVDPSIVADTVYDNTTVEVVESASKGSLSNGGGHWWSMRIDIKDSVHPPEMTITDTDRNDDILWQKKFVQYRGGNQAFDTTKNLTAKGATVGVDL